MGEVYLNRSARDLRRNPEMLPFFLQPPGKATENAMEAYGGDKIGIGYGNRRPVSYSQ